jgi:hypothetical protein
MMMIMMMTTMIIIAVLAEVVTEVSMEEEWLRCMKDWSIYRYQSWQDMYQMMWKYTIFQTHIWALWTISNVLSYQQQQQQPQQQQSTTIETSHKNNPKNK